MRKNLFWLSDGQWERIEPHLPTDVRGVERQDDRRVISGIVHVLKSGCPQLWHSGASKPTGRVSGVSPRMRTVSPSMTRTCPERYVRFDPRLVGGSLFPVTIGKAKGGCRRRCQKAAPRTMMLATSGPLPTIKARVSAARQKAYARGKCREEEATCSC